MIDVDQTPFGYQLLVIILRVTASGASL